MMTPTEHFAAIVAGNIKPRVVEHPPRHPDCARRYVAWTPTWEGPPRPEYMAARADLADRLGGAP